MEQRWLDSFIRYKSADSISAPATSTRQGGHTVSYAVDDGPNPSVETFAPAERSVAALTRRMNTEHYRDGVPCDGSSIGQSPRLITGLVPVQIRLVARNGFTRGSRSGEHTWSTTRARRVRSPRLVPFFIRLDWLVAISVLIRHLAEFDSR
jgi:hypothetical protein